MKTPAYYRDLAERSRRLARMTLSQEASAQMSTVAEEYERLADEVEGSHRSMPQQVKEQQQSDTKKD